MKHAFTLATITLALAYSPAYAEDDDHGHNEERAKHFEVKEPTSLNDALRIVREKGAEMQAAYAEQDYGKMHELSYHLEVAADYLEEEAGELMEAVEEVHHATEDGEMEVVDKKFPNLKKHLKNFAAK